MEAGGLSVGIITLAGLFNNAVDSYGYVRLGKSHARDFQTSQAKLDLSRIQLSRWGEALGVTASVAETMRLSITLGSTDEIVKDEQALGYTVDLLDDAQFLSRRYKDRESGEAVAALDPNDSELHQ